MSETKLPNSAKELRNLYNVSDTTWVSWLKPIRDKIRLHAKIYTPKEVTEIINLLGAP